MFVILFIINKVILQHLQKTLNSEQTNTAIADDHNCNIARDKKK